MLPESTLSREYLLKLEIPLAVTQQLVDLHARQGQLQALLNGPLLNGQATANRGVSPDLLAVMAAKSRRAALMAMQEGNDAIDWGYQGALRYLSRLEEEGLSTQLNSQHILDLHRQLNDNGGRWRSVKLNTVRPDQQDRPLSHQIGHQQIEVAMASLVDDLNHCSIQGISPAISIALLSMELMKIFPFIDGNLRLLLLLSRHLLTASDISIVNYINLESEFRATEKPFYRALNLSIESNNPKRLISYWCVVIKRLYQRFEQQLKLANIPVGRGSKSALIRQYVLQQAHSFRLQGICEALPSISHDQIRISLRKLRDEGLIQAQGRGRAALWVKL